MLSIEIQWTREIKIKEETTSTKWVEKRIAVSAMDFSNFQKTDNMKENLGKYIEYVLHDKSNIFSFRANVYDCHISISEWNLVCAIANVQCAICKVHCTMCNVHAVYILSVGLILKRNVCDCAFHINEIPFWST